MADLKVVDAEQLDADLTIVADAIRSKGGTTEKLEFPQGMKQAVEAISSGGGGGLPMWLPYMKSLQNAFQNVTFPSGTELDITLATEVDMHDDGMNSAFAYTLGVKRIKLSCANKDKGVSFITAFMSSRGDVEVIDLTDFTKVFTKATQVFYGCTKLVSILGDLDFSKCVDWAMGNAFTQLPKLENVRFKTETIKYSISFAHSPLLSDESIQSIIDGLATVETAQTLTFNADVKAKLTDTQLTTITSKNWTLA